MRLFSWNVNGLRAVLKNGFMDFVSSHDPDMLCLQEVKASPEQVAWELPGYHQYWNCAEKAGYSGTLLLSKAKPLAVKNGVAIAKHDKEGRVITAEYENFFLVNVYTPNSQRGLTRHKYRIEEWECDFLSHLKKLEKEKPVIFCGDLNVAHKEIDLANPKSNVKNAGFTPEERACFDKIMAAGFIDTFRAFNMEPGQYTWWTYRNNARSRNIGWRIDYFCVSKGLKPHLKQAGILPEVHGSDHCPIFLEIAF